MLKGVKNIVLHIFDAGGNSVPLFQKLGGEDGFFIVPEYGFENNSGSVSVRYKPRKTSFGQLPIEVQNKLKYHPHFKIGKSKIYMCLFPSHPPQYLMERLSDARDLESINDVLLLSISAFETATHSDMKRRVEMGRSMEGMVGKKYSVAMKQVVKDDEND